jgi:hypothetical protein
MRSGDRAAAQASKSDDVFGYRRGVLHSKSIRFDRMAAGYTAGARQGLHSIPNTDCSSNDISECPGGRTIVSVALSGWELVWLLGDIVLVSNSFVPIVRDAPSPNYWVKLHSIDRFS